MVGETRQDCESHTETHTWADTPDTPTDTPDTPIRVPQLAGQPGMIVVRVWISSRFGDSPLLHEGSLDDCKMYLVLSAQT